ncbi:MAG: L,D-transpeptidase family protein, partial [Verrucomicrobiota bacterium]
QAFYKNVAFQPVWSGTRLGELAQFMQELKYHGLDPRIFNYDAWNQAWMSPPPDATGRAELDVGTTELALFIIDSLAYGYVTPTDVHEQWRPVSRKISSVEWLTDAMRQQPTSMRHFLLTNVPPSNRRYKKMVEFIREYEKHNQNGGWANLPTPTGPVNIGSTYAGLDLLRARLMAEGDLPRVDYSRGRKDVPTMDKLTSDALRSFQFRHGIDTDGALGPMTLSELNKPVSERIKTLVINLDRLRWLPRTYEQDEHIEVNIAEGALRVFEKGRRQTTMKVIVGVKGKHQTPVFRGDLSYLVFRPYWNVPKKIARDELVPHALKDPQGYMARNNYEITTGSSAPMPNTVENLNKVAAGQLFMRQTTGPHNSLGLVKFIFPNSNAVYLHDTNKRHLFSATDRDFSHGCVRVSKPDELAYIVLRRNGGWDINKVNAAMEDGTNPNNKVNLKRHIPVYLLYWSSMIMGDDRVRFDQDIYGHDAVMKQKFGL